MLLKVNPHNIEIVKSPVNEREINISKCEFVFSDEITNEYVKEAYFTFKGTTYKQIIVNDECDFPSEVLTKKGTVEIGVVAFLVEDETEIKRYNPSPAYFNTWVGSLKEEYENTEPITPTDKEQIEQMLNNINLDAEKVDKITTITITFKDGSTKIVTLEDGIGINYRWNGTSLGIKREDEGNYTYVDLKGEKGEAGAIKMVIVQSLPLVGDNDTIYLVPLAEPESQENSYAEYVYINGKWELLGKIGIQVDLTDYYTKQETNTLLNGKADVEDIPDLTDYVKNIDYATSNKGGVVKIGGIGHLASSNGVLYAETFTYANYLNNGAETIIGKGTLENVIAGKDLTTKAYVDGLVGDIDTALDLINGEVIS